MVELKLGDILEQYRITEILKDNIEYKQITISQTGNIKVRGYKKGALIGRKRQFFIDLEAYPNTLLFVRQGVQKGGIGIAGKDIHGSIATENMPMFEISDKVNPIYLDFYLKSITFKNRVASIEATGTAQKSIHENVLLKVKIRLPSRKEQDFLVEKLIEAKKNFTVLNNGYLDQEENLIKLRQSILQDAVQGKLSEDWRKLNHNIEPAIEILKKIKIEKVLLVKENRIKKEKLLPSITKEQIPFEIPESWEYTRLGEIAEFISSGSRGWAKYYSKKGAKFIRMGNLSKNSLEMRLDNVQFINPPAKGEGTRTRLQTNDYLISITGEVGMLGKVPEYFGEAYINQHTALVRILSILQNDFIDILLLSPFSKEQFNAPQRGIKNSFRLSDLKELIIVLPPIEEQKTIVEKVNQLIANCETLEYEINKSKTNAEKLMQAVLSELLGEEQEGLVNKSTSKNVIKKAEREIKYNSKTLLMDLVELLEANGKTHAEDLWKMSKYPKDIDEFYAELKKQIEIVKSIKEVENEKGYLEIV